MRTYQPQNAGRYPKDNVPATEPKTSEPTGAQKNRLLDMRRRRHKILGLLGLGVCLEVVCVLLTSPIFNIQYLDVRGAETLREIEIQEIVSVARPKPRTNLFRTSFTGIENRLKKMPAFSQPKITRQLPNRIIVEVKPQVPVAVVEMLEQTVEVNAAGIPIRFASAEYSSHLPAIVFERQSRCELGISLADEALLQALEIYSKFKSHPTIAIETINIDASGNIGLNMKGRLVVHLGLAEQEMKKKLAYLEKMFTHVSDPASRYTAINLKCITAPVVTYRNTMPPLASSVSL